MPGNGNTRTTGAEQYYTPRDVARRLVDDVLSVAPWAAGRFWLEPAAGDGAFVDAFLSTGISPERVVAIDTEPKHPLVSQGDFLTKQLNLTGAVCVTNPPFGRNHALSVPFFNKAAEFCDLIAFVVPRSWRKWSVINRLDSRMHLLTDVDLAITYLDDDGQELAGGGKHLRTVFQVWEKRQLRREPITVEDRGYITKTTPDEADVALTVFGRGCGTVTADFPRQPNTTKMFLRASPEVADALRAVDLSRYYNNVAYVEALSIKEIRDALNRHFDGLAA